MNEAEQIARRLSDAPGADDICAFLREGYGDFVVNMPQGTRAEPEEIWVPGLACWVRADGTRATFDITHQFAHREFGLFDRWRIRRAVTRFRRLSDWSQRVRTLLESEES